MPVCKFFMQGNCKFGDRCRYEHPRQSRGGHGGHDYSDNRWKDKNQGGYRSNQGYQGRYENQRGNDQWFEEDGNGFREQRHGYHNSRSNKHHDYHHGHEDSHSQRHQNRDRSKNTSEDRNHNNDRYHWSKDKNAGTNRFGALSNDATQDSQADSVFSTIKGDIEIWAGSSMWPFSSYSHDKGTACVDGLPDISPEEMRVIYLLHPQQYQNIWNEVEANFCQKKDELFEMNDTTKGNLQSQFHAKDSNPSENLKLSLLYGPTYNFSKQTSLPSNDALPKTAQPTPNPFSSQNTSAMSNSAGTSKEAAASCSNTSDLAKPSGQTLSIFGSASVVNAKNNSVKDVVYTPDEELTDVERASFEAPKFVLGKIPIRPPSQKYCR